MEERVLILAPRGRDAPIAAELIQRHGLHSRICLDLPSLIFELSTGAGAVLITEEALASGDTSALTRWIDGQPGWSDMPFIVLANGVKSPRSAAALSRLSDLGNIVLLERPLHAEAMVGALRSALKARRRQYQVRGSAEALENAVVERTADLEAARRKLQLALDAAAMGSWDLDLASGTIERSLRHDQIFGYDTLQPEWTINTFLAHVDLDHRAAIQDVLVQALSIGTVEFECPLTHGDGALRWALLKGQVQYDDVGTAYSIAGVISDITDRKEADAKLAQAQKMDAVGHLTGGVAHDFNNLLTPIVGALDLLRRHHSDDEKSQKLVGGALQAAERATTLTQRLLAFARRQALQPRAVDIGDLIDGLVDLIRRSLGPTIEVIVDVSNHLPPAKIDPNQLELALLNLAINARDAMPGGGRLALKAVTTSVGDHHPLGISPGTYVRVASIDTGVGMDSATVARAAEPFFSTKGVGKGTGLGLSMAHGLAAQSGGALHIESSPGCGTTIELWIPATSEPAANQAPSIGEPIAARQSAKIILVDDEDIVRAATADMLRDLGYDILEFSSPTRALAAFRTGLDADVLVTDYLMPAMTGAQMIAEIRTAGYRLPTLLITGYAAQGEDLPEDIDRLAKPFRQADLAKHIDALLTRPRDPGRLTNVG